LRLKCDDERLASRAHDPSWCFDRERVNVSTENLIPTTSMPIELVTKQSTTGLLDVPFAGKPDSENEPDRSDANVDFKLTKNLRTSSFSSIPAIDADIYDHPGLSERFRLARFQFRENQCESVLDFASSLMARVLEERTHFDSLRDRYLYRSFELEELKLSIEKSELDLNEHYLNALNNAERKEADLALANVLVSKTIDAKRVAALARPEWKDEMATAAADPNVRATARDRYREELDDIVRNATASARQMHADALSSLAGKEETRSVGMRTYLQNLRTLEARRISATEEKNGCHDLVTQMNAIQVRVVRDLIEAFDRIRTGAIGLRRFFGYTGNHPTVEIAKIKQLSLIDIFVQWLRDATHFLNARASVDQAVVLTVSLREIMGEKYFHRGMAGDKDNIIRMAFVVPQDRFDAMLFPRLRGVSANLRSAQDGLSNGIFVKHHSYPIRGVATGRIRPPLSALTTFPEDGVEIAYAPFAQRSRSTLIFDGNTASLPLVSLSGSNVLSQSDCSWVRLSRIRTRGGNHESDISGVATMINFSPISDDRKGVGFLDKAWILELKPKTTANEQLAKVIEDIEVDLHVVYVDAGVKKSCVTS
jgi:hypothetical protein